MMPKKQTSPEVSAIAGKYVRMRNREMFELLTWFGGELNGKAAERFFRDVRKLAASCLAQDETKGTSQK